jgi:phage terminase large subunit
MADRDIVAIANDDRLNAYDLASYGKRIDERDFTDDERASNILGTIRPRAYQVPSVNFMLERDPLDPSKFKEGLRASLCDHRRSGKTLRNVLIVLMRAMQHKGTYFFIYPTLNQGRKVLWDGIGYDEKREAFNFMDLFPWVKKDNHLMQMRLANGSIIQIVGAIGIDGTSGHLRGTNPIFACYDEFAEMALSAWHDLFAVFSENGGSVMFTFTPKGKNHAHDIHLDYVEKFESAYEGGRFFAETLTIDDTKRPDGRPVVDAKYLDELRAQGVSESYIQQEFYCSFEVANEGTFYAEQLERASKEGRIGQYGHDPRVPTVASYDLGIGVSDWVTVWYLQVHGNKRHLIRYEEFPGKALMDIVPHVDKRYNVVAHIVPWDAKRKDDVTGLTKIERLEEMKVTSSPFVRVERVSIEHGIDLVRGNFHNYYFDKVGCYEGIERLRKYQKQIDRTTGLFKKAPLHDEASHGADSLRTYANAEEQGLLDDILDLVDERELSEYAIFEVDYF